MAGQLIKKHLDENGIKYSFIANALGISINVLSTMLSGKRKIAVEEFVDICELLKVDTNYFAEKIRQAKHAEHPTDPTETEVV